MFSLFIAIAFTVESVRAIHWSFMNNYYGCDENYVEEGSVPSKPPPLPHPHTHHNYTLLQQIVNPELQHNLTVVSWVNNNGTLSLYFYAYFSKTILFVRFRSTIAAFHAIETLPFFICC